MKVLAFIGNFFKKFLKYILTFILAVLVAVLGLIFIFEKGPSDTIRDVYVTTVMQSSAAKFTARIFLSQETVDAIMADAQTQDAEVLVDPDLVTVGGDDENFDIDAVYVEDIQTSHYKGKVMIINDPSRVYVYCIPEFPVERGKTMTEIIAENDVIGGVNGGGFIDVGGQGKGGEPKGLVISEGKYLNGDLDTKYSVIGITDEDKLVVGTMTGQQAIDMGIRDAVCWGPALIINGEAVSLSESADGPNPRTAIGQRADGAIILVVIEGRKLDSIGASYNDLIEIMQKYGAVNASNLDGGLSSSMHYEGEQITGVYSIYNERPIPTAILVRR